MIEDVVEYIETNKDDRFHYGIKKRNGEIVTEWVRITDSYLAQIGKENSEKSWLTLEGKIKKLI